MALHETLLCTALPRGLSEKGNPVVTVFFSPHLEQTGAPSLLTLHDYSPGGADDKNPYLSWPKVMDSATFTVVLDAGTATAVTITDDKLARLSKTDPTLWQAMFAPSTPVIPYDYKTGMTDMYIRSFPVGMVLGWMSNLVRQVAAKSDEAHPKLGEFLERLGDIELHVQRPRTQEPTAVGIKAAPPSQLRPRGYKREYGALTEKVNGIIDRMGRALGQAPGLTPSVREDLLWLLQDSISELRPETLAALNEIAMELASKKAVSPSATPNPTKDFLQASLFFRPRTARSMDHIQDPVGHPDAYVRPKMPSPADLAKQTDFHKIVGGFGQHPALLRSMGLAIDLELPGGVLNPTGTISVTPSLPTSATKQVPMTAYKFAGSEFVARPSSTEVVDGMLAISDPKAYGVHQIDADGSTVKVLDLATNMRRRSVRAKFGTPETGTIPAMRSGGLALVQTGRAERTVKRLQKQYDNHTSLQANSPTTLYAEDVMRGFRVDIYDEEEGLWRSLYRRDGTYAFKGISDPVKPGPDEGLYQTTGTKMADGSTKDLYIHERLFTWQGWSLAAPRPGKVVGPDDASDASGKVDIRDPKDPSPPPDKQVDVSLTNMKVRFTALKLPKLRFGRKYKMRLRTVDLAGNSLTLEEADAVLSKGGGSTTGTHGYYRFEPVLPPTVSSPSSVMTQDFKPWPRKTPIPPSSKAPSGAQIPGESLHVLVIRSVEGTSIGDYVPTFKAMFSPALPSYSPTDDRTIVVPSSSGDMAERHGMLDSGGKLDPAAYKKYLVDTGKSPDDLASNKFLPDPIARGATARIFRPGAPAVTVSNIDWYDGGSWPDAKPFKLLAQEDDPSSLWDSGSRTLTIPVKKSEIVRVLLSANLRKEDVQRLMGIWQWISDSAGPGPIPSSVLDDMLKRAVEGRNWLITPFVEVTLVHAVQRPLSPAPFISKLQTGLLKVMGATNALLSGQITKHGPSTGKMTLLAAWKEYVDDPTTPDMPKIGDRAMQVFDEKMTNVDKIFDFTPVKEQKRHEFGDTKHRMVDYTPVGTTSFREYFPPETKEADLSLQGVKKTVNIFSSARPEKPNILYVIPTFGWDDIAKDDKGATHNRKGGLRVYMDRPWYSSGEGERLAVILRDGGTIPGGALKYTPPAIEDAGLTLADSKPSLTTTVSDKLTTLGSSFTKLSVFTTKGTEDILKPYITQWGMDPLWKSNPTYPDPRFTHFMGSPELSSAKPMMDKGLSLAELPNSDVRVDAVAFDVQADPVRKLWYADLEIDAGPSYMPFVRLALARYQPDSVRNGPADTPDCCLSHIVLADFIQIVPGRRLSIIFDSDPHIITVAVVGVSYRASDVGEISSRITVGVEVKSGMGTDTELAWVPADATIDMELDRVYGAGPALWDGMWTGRVVLPDSRLTTKFRIVVKEFETYFRDPEKMWDGTKPADPFLATRLVYADAIEIG